MNVTLTFAENALEPWLKSGRFTVFPCPSFGKSGVCLFGHIFLETSYALPINTPAPKTSAPPRTTWKAARQNGVSI
jgi:hypothetical protein